MRHGDALLWFSIYLTSRHDPSQRHLTDAAVSEWDVLADARSVASPYPRRLIDVEHLLIREKLVEALKVSPVVG